MLRFLFSCFRAGGVGGVWGKGTLGGAQELLLVLCSGTTSGIAQGLFRFCAQELLLVVLRCYYLFCAQGSLLVLIRGYSRLFAQKVPWWYSGQWYACQGWNQGWQPACGASIAASVLPLQNRMLWFLQSLFQLKFTLSVQNSLLLVLLSKLTFS